MTTVRLVYVIGGLAGPVKIGVSTNPNDRLAQLCGESDAVKMPTGVDRSALRVLYATEGDGALERYLHRRFHRQRLVGEWFDLGPPDLAWRHVQAAIETRSTPVELDLNLGSFDDSRRVSDLVHDLYSALDDPSTRAGLRQLFPSVFLGPEALIG